MTEISYKALHRCIMLNCQLFSFYSNMQVFD